MHDRTDLAIARARRELAQRIFPHVHRTTAPLAVTAWHAPGEPVPYDHAIRQRFEPFSVGERWGPPWSTTWFRLTGDVPDDWPASQVEAVVDLGFAHRGAGFQAEGLVWRDGHALQGVHPRRTAVPLPGAQGTVDLFVEAAANPVTFTTGFRPTPLGDRATAGCDPLYRLTRAQLAWRDDAVMDLVLDLEVLIDLASSLPRADPRRAQVIAAISDALDMLHTDDVASSAAIARAVLAAVLRTPARPSAMRVVGVGHAHIDTAWLWPMRESIRKCARTFASAVALMDDNPAYRFVCSQAVHLDWMREHHPDLFTRIVAKVRSGQLVPTGGMWVEADMNLPSGESLVRQLVHGQRWFTEHAGVRCTEAWLPDVFGYPASLPQIFASAGLTRFVTQKLSWNKQNRFPHHTFWWEGLDGTRVLTHFPPVDTYNAEVTASEMIASEQRFAEHAWSRWALMPFGYGNGGGGPTREMLARAHRMDDLDGVPTLTLGSPDDFFTRVERELHDRAAAPVWRGELYFEMHRGTLTSQLATKAGNRRCERLLREAELWWAAVDEPMPADVSSRIDACWKDVLTQQFHDILPGTSIAWVHDDAVATFDRVASQLESIIAAAFEHIGVQGHVVANCATRDRREIVTTSPTVFGPGPTQRLTTGEVAALVEVPGSGWAPLRAHAPVDAVVVEGRTMRNDLVALTWDAHGSIVSIVDRRRDRELLPPGERIELQLAPDHPVEYDAWDLESWTPSLGTAVDAPAIVDVVERGPLVGLVRVRRHLGSASTVTTDIVLHADSARVDLAIDIDWHEDEQLLSLCVPLDVRADTAACGIQFGHVRRPTHPTTSWDDAKFEVCVHRFVDLAEPSFGVAVLNDGRNGHGVFGGSVRVSLARAPKFPDPGADHGRHRVTIAVLPHGPGLHEVLEAAEALDLPLRLVHGEGTAPGGQVVDIDHPGVDASAVKRADDGSGDLVVRVVEMSGDRSCVHVGAPTPFAAAWTCDALEVPAAPVHLGADGRVELTLRPFEIVTLRCRPQ
jgi:alpha-mannosidase